MSRIHDALERARGQPAPPEPEAEAAPPGLEELPGEGLWEETDNRGAHDMPARLAPGADMPGARLDVVTGTLAAAVEQFRRVAGALHSTQLERGTKVVMVASAQPQEGKTLTITHLAATLSESYQRRVLLIDADLRRPTLHELFGLPNDSGLNDGLKAERPMKLAIHRVSPQLWLLPAGPANPDPMSGLTSARMHLVVEEAATKFDWVLLDTPPVGLLADAALLTSMVHAVLLVIDATRSSYAAAQRAIDALGRARILGVVLNRLRPEPFTWGREYVRYYRRYVEQRAAAGAAPPGVR